MRDLLLLLLFLITHSSLDKTHDIHYKTINGHNHVRYLTVLILTPTTFFAMPTFQEFLFQCKFLTARHLRYVCCWPILCFTSANWRSERSREVHEVDAALGTCGTNQRCHRSHHNHQNHHHRYSAIIMNSCSQVHKMNAFWNAI